MTNTTLPNGKATNLSRINVTISNDSLRRAAIICILSITVSILVSQSNCQTQHQSKQAQSNSDCASRNRQLAKDNGNKQINTSQRQQRQFNQNRPAINIANQPQERSLADSDQHEEFSLASGNGSSGPQASSNYTLLSQQQPVIEQPGNTSAATSIANDLQQQAAISTTPSMPSDSIGSPVVAQPPVTTSSLIAAGTPVAGQPVVSTGGSVEQDILARNNNRQVEDTTLATTTTTTSSTVSAPLSTTRQLSGARSVGSSGGASGLQPVSSSPSSISIITPLNGSPVAMQQQQHHAHVTSVSASIGGGIDTTNESPHSTMMKPLLVLGNPISERDYQPQASLQNENNNNSNKVQKTVSDNQIETNHAPSKVATSRIDKSAEQAAEAAEQHASNSSSSQQNSFLMNTDRMNGPPLVYSDGHLSAEQPAQQPQPAQQQAATPRLFHGSSGQTTGAAVVGNNPRRPSLPPPVNQANAASGFRSPMSPSGPLIGTSSAPATILQTQPQPQQQQPAQLQPPVNAMAASQFYQASPPYAGASSLSPLYSVAGGSSSGSMNQLSVGSYNKQPAFLQTQAPVNAQQLLQMQQQQMMTAHSLAALPPVSQQTAALPVTIPSSAVASPGTGYSGRRPLNITRVEHISAECSNDLIKAVIVFNGTFKGIIYSSGYVSDPTCLYVNGTGSTRYEFHIRLNQCGTLGSEKLHHPTIPGEARRRDQVMFNTLSIQYNSIIEQEWDEHFKVSCEYGSDFWKTVSFSPFNVETNTGSPVVFTINPPQCQMDVLLGHGMGPKIVDGPVTVGDPLTLLIHMKSEKAGYDILVKNCVAHNGSKQKMQLIDSNGCVVNERFISPFRGTYNDNDLRHVTLYAYLKAFRFTGSPVLYLECEIHMCQSACPPQMCYWRRLSKRSVDNFDYEYTTNSSTAKQIDDEKPVISESLSLFKALQVRQEPEPSRARQDRQLQHRTRDIFAEDDKAALVCYRYAEVWIFLTTIASLLTLVVTIAATCCWRFRKLSRSQFQHNRFSSSAGSLSPSLLSISDAISSAGSFIGKASMLGTPTLAANLTSPNGRFHQQSNRLEQHQRHGLSPNQTINTNATVWRNQQRGPYLQHQQHPALSPAYHTASKSGNCPTFHTGR